MFHKLDGAKLPLGLRLICSAAIAALTAVLIAIVILSGPAAPGLQAEVAAQLARSGVDNPVTAVLLNFRSYDTLLEVAVLLVVAVATMPAPGRRLRPALAPTGDMVLIGLIDLVVPVVVVVGAYLLWVGAYAPGGAFQAGALLAGAGVLVSITGRFQFSFGALPARAILALGLLTFTVTAAAVALQTGVFFQYPTAAAGVLILFIEAAATISIAATLVLLYGSLVPPAQESGP